MPSPTDGPTARQEPRDSHRLFGVGALLAGLAVAAGAFGAHALEARVSAALLETFKTGAYYHLTQSLGVLALALAAERWHRPTLRAAGWLVVAGTGIFAGSLYLLVLTGIRGFGAVTPVGGVLLIAGWLWAGACLIRIPRGA